jgi:hypothetical protein
MKQLIPLQPQEIGSPWLQLQPVHIESILHQQRSTNKSVYIQQLSGCNS